MLSVPRVPQGERSRVLGAVGNQVLGSALKGDSTFRNAGIVGESWLPRGQEEVGLEVRLPGKQRSHLGMANGRPAVTLTAAFSQNLHPMCQRQQQSASPPCSPRPHGPPWPLDTLGKVDTWNTGSLCSILSMRFARGTLPAAQIPAFLSLDASILFNRFIQELLTRCVRLHGRVLRQGDGSTCVPELGVPGWVPQVCALPVSLPTEGVLRGGAFAVPRPWALSLTWSQHPSVDICGRSRGPRPWSRGGVVLTPRWQERIT